jgi:predicted RNase H-like nuclease (RuvC/YqgF family)
MASKSKGESANPKADGGASGNINQIRDILIGPLQREQEASFARVEQTLERLEREAEDRTARAQEKLTKSLEAAVTALESRIGDLSKRVDQLDETTRRDASQLASDIEREIKEMQTRLTSEMQSNERATDKRFTVLRQELDAELANLRDDKTSRHDLGDYLAEIGLRLKGEASLQALDASLLDALNGGTK